jgi:hypothetical protein
MNNRSRSAFVPKKNSMGVCLILVMLIALGCGTIYRGTPGTELVIAATETPSAFATLGPTFTASATAINASRQATLLWEAASTVAAGLTPMADPSPSGLPGTVSNPADTLSLLQGISIPPADPRELAVRLGGVTFVPDSVPSEPFSVGDQQTFWVGNLSTNEIFQVTATLQYTTAHAYFWMDNNFGYVRSDLVNLAEAFEQKIYPIDRAFFGSEWTPGIDADAHIYILFTRNVGANGYFASTDEYPRQVNQYSNQHEMFIFSSTQLGRRSDYGVLAHEFQHMIHWNQDRNEQAWMNEGFSEVAALINGYPSSGWEVPYLQDPNLQLNDWPVVGGSGPHYGASFLYLAYFLDRFGESATQALVREQRNGLESVDYVLEQMNALDPLTGQPIRADDVFMDWAVANFLRDDSVGDGRYDYHLDHISDRRSEPVADIDNCASYHADRTVYQYGVEYLRFACRDDVTLHFQGALTTNLTPQAAHSGARAFWSNKGDDSDITLTRDFDFTNASGTLTLQYWTWYFIELNYDYMYVEASTDGGQTWEILITPAGTGEDPLDSSYGWGYTGASDGWIEQSLDLSRFAGQKIQLRFEYVTDGAANGEGFWLDDVSIPEIYYATDFESDDGGWNPDGWARVENILPQTFRLALIRIGQTTTVEYLTLDAGNTIDIPLRFSGDLREAILVVTGTTRFTRQQASYSIEVR